MRSVTPDGSTPFDERGRKRSDPLPMLDLLQLSALNLNARLRSNYHRSFDRLRDAHTPWAPVTVAECKSRKTAARVACQQDFFLFFYTASTTSKTRAGPCRVYRRSLDWWKGHQGMEAVREDTWRGVMELETVRTAHSSQLPRVQLALSDNTEHTHSQGSLMVLKK